MLGFFPSFSLILERPLQSFCPFGLVSQLFSLALLCGCLNYEIYSHFPMKLGGTGDARSVSSCFMK